MKVSKEMKNLITARCEALVQKQNERLLRDALKDNAHVALEFRTIRARRDSSDKALEDLKPRLEKAGFDTGYNYDYGLVLSHTHKFASEPHEVATEVIARLQSTGDDTTANFDQIGEAIKLAFANRGGA